MSVHSVCCCAPYFETEKPQWRTRSFGVQPISGTVRIGSPPAASVSSTKMSAVEPSGSVPGSGWDSML